MQCGEHGGRGEGAMFSEYLTLPGHKNCTFLIYGPLNLAGSVDMDTISLNLYILLSFMHLYWLNGCIEREKKRGVHGER
jgi:hypothetical protein